MAKPTYLVDVQWLTQHINSPNIIVIDTRFSLPEPDLGRRQYEAGHIPGAYYLDLNRDLSSTVKAHGGRHPLPNWNSFVAKLNRIGIHSASPDGPTQVVIYDDSRFAFAARLWWMLRYLGHHHVAILDGGIRAWEAAGLSLSQEVPAEKPGAFMASPQPDWIVDIDALRLIKDRANVIVIDSRSPERWRGEVEPIDPIAGSVPGSVNAFWQNVTTATGQLKSEDELSEQWVAIVPKHIASDSPGSSSEVIVYCGSGVTACVNLFSLVMAGRPMYKLYPGGWSDWCSYLDT